MKTNVCEWALAATLALCPLLSPAQTTGGGADTVVSISFANGKPENNEIVRVGETGTLGIEPVPATEWVDMVVPDRSKGNQALRGSGEITAAYSDASAVTLPTPIHIEYWAANGWSYGTAEATRTFLRTYLDDSNGGASVFLSDIPFATYDVIVYCATDTVDSLFVPVTINGTRYSWNTDGLVANAASNAFWGETGANSAEQGVNAIRVDGLSGNLSIVGGRSEVVNRVSRRGGIAAIQIVGHGEIVEPTPVRALSVNFASGQGTSTFNVPASETAAYGIVPIPGTAWKNVTGDTGTDVEIDSAYGFTLSEDNRPTLSYGAALTWSYGSDATPIFLRGFLSDAEGFTPITVKNIPFASYDVIIYYGADGDSGSRFKPISVNGRYYTWDGEANATVPTEDTSAFFGQTGRDYVAYGVNALRIPVPEGGDLTIERQTRGNDGRCSIAAFQIVETFPSSEVRPVISLNFSSGAANNGFVQSSAVASLSGSFGIEPVPGAYWTDLGQNPNGNSVTATLSKVYGVSEAFSSTVTYSAATTWGYPNGSATGASPILTTYLDDGGSGARVAIDDLPFGAYDVIVYGGADKAEGPRFKPVNVNGTLYKGDATAGAVVASGENDAYGTGLQAEPALGVNALRVDKLVGPLAIQGMVGSDGAARGGIAAVQIVGREIVDVALSGALTAEELATRLAEVPEDAMARLVVATGTQVSGDVDLSGVIVDLSAYEAGETPPFSGTVTIDQRTVVRVAGDVRRIALTSGNIVGTLRPANIYIGDVAATGATVTDGTIVLALTFQWTGAGGNTLWSNPANWSSGVVPGVGDAVEIPVDGATDIVLDTDAAVGALTISGPTATGTGVATLALSAQGDGALTVSGQMLTTGNVAVTQNANITVNGKSTMVLPNGAPRTYPYPGAFHVEGASATYTVASGTLAVPTEPVEHKGTDVEATAGGYVTVCGGATLTVGAADGETACISAYRFLMAWPPSDVSRNGTVRVAPNGTLEVAYQSSFSSGLTLDVQGGTLRATKTAIITNSSASYTPTSPVTLASNAGASLTLSGTLSGAADLRVAGPGTVAFESNVFSGDYTGEIVALADANLSLGAAQRPALAVEAGATVAVTPSVGESAIGQIVFPTSMGTVPEGATFTVADVTETVTPAVVDGTLTLSWPVAIPTLAESSAWSAVGNWTDVSGDAAPTSGAAILDGTAAPITVKLDTALTDMTSIIVRGDVTLVTADEQPTIPACVTLADGATLIVSADFGGAWTLPAGTTLRVADASVSLAGLTLNGAVELAFSDATYEAALGFHGGLIVSGDNVTVNGVSYIGDAETRLAGDSVHVVFGDGTSFYNLTELVNAGEGNSVTNIQNLNGEIRVESGSLTLEVVGDMAPGSFKGATIAEGATLKFTNVGTQGQLAVSGAGTLDLGTCRKQLAARADGPLPKTLRLTATAEEQTANLISFAVYGDAALPADFVAEVAPAEGGIEWVPMSALEGDYLRIRNVPGPGIAGLSAEAELAIRKWWREEVGKMPTSPYVVEVHTGGETYDASSSAERLALLNGVFACFENVALSSDVAGDSETPSTIALWYDFGIAGLAANGTGLNVTVRAEQDPETPLKFRAGAVVEVLCGGEVVGRATAEEGNGGTVTVTLGTIPEGEIAVRVADEPATTPAQ